MALTEPFDFLGEFPGWTISFDLKMRQEQSRTVGGRTLVKDFGPPLWLAKIQSKIMNPNQLDYWRARMKYMEEGLYTFIGYPLSRKYPILYPSGSWPTGLSFLGTTARLTSVNVNRKAVVLSSLPAGYRGSIGDYISIDGDLHQVMETFLADGSGVTGEFEVRPHIWDGVAGSTSPPTFVSVKEPSCLMSIIPGTLSTPAGLNGWGSVSFDALEARE